jgi:hypothetical protein
LINKPPAEKKDRGDFFHNFKNQLKEILMNPIKEYPMLLQISFQKVLSYYILLLIIFSILFSVLGSFVIGFITPELFGYTEISRYLGIISLAFFFFLVLAGFICIFFIGLILHLFIYIFGGREHVTQTLKIVLFSCTPFLLLGWIPIIGLLTLFWTAVLIIIGIKIAHKITLFRSVMSIMSPIIIIVGVASILVFVI